MTAHNQHHPYQLRPTGHSFFMQSTMVKILGKQKHINKSINKHLSKAYEIHTFIDGRIPSSEAATVSDFANKLFKSSSLVSAPVFFNFGETTERDVPSLKEDAVLILSA